eukprot:gb/GEZN01006371.1/.p1 GENE.gb/GEZN01006371.1/~~gb/GEZN01006371.1/.p1  ORF type:complete len:355 (+),score=40.09 gb/GEZN01006371.1/:121-1185(+)
MITGDMAGDAFLWGFLSAVSLPMGACVALCYSFRLRTIAWGMAFGGGALLFALSVEIYGKAIAKNERGGPWEELCLICFSILGSIAYLFLNRKLNEVATDDVRENSYIFPHQASTVDLTALPKRDRRRREKKDLNESKSSHTSMMGQQLGLADSYEMDPSPFLPRNESGKNLMDVDEDDNSAVSETLEHGSGGGRAALSVWLGIALDSIPESMVIGFLTKRSKMSAGLLVGVFLSNFPEALASAGLMRKMKMNYLTIILLWGSLAITTGLGSMLVVLVFRDSNPDNSTVAYFTEASAEGMAGGAMLCMISGQLMPHAYERGGEVSGLFSVGGFLAALIAKCAINLDGDGQFDDR